MCICSTFTIVKAIQAPPSIVNILTELLVVRGGTPSQSSWMEQDFICSCFFKFFNLSFFFAYLPLRLQIQKGNQFLFAFVVFQSTVLNTE